MTKDEQKESASEKPNPMNVNTSTIKDSITSGNSVEVLLLRERFNQEWRESPGFGRWHW